MFKSDSPLQKARPVKVVEGFPKEKPNISVATAKKILKAAKRPVGTAEAVWLNYYIENRVRGECLPRAFLSNDLPSEIVKAYGAEGAEKFLGEVLAAFAKVTPPPGGVSVSPG
jgi:hypothetical protein